MNIFALFRGLKNFNGIFLLCLIALQIIGLISIYSASFESPNIFKQQILWIVLSWLVFLTVYNLKISLISWLLWSAYAFNILALILVFFVGKEIYSAQRWLDLGFFHYQPSETLKLVLLLLTAKKLAQRPLTQQLSFLEILAFLLFILPPLALVLLQPDLGTAGITLVAIVSLFLFNGIEKKTLLVFMTAFMVSLPLTWQFVLKPYQKDRIQSFLKPGADPQGTGYNVIQSKIAIGSGKFFGKGFRKGTQNNLQFLPERHTDFIFSVLSEEWGFLGSLLTLSLLLGLIVLIFYLAGQTRDRLSCYFCLAVGFFMFWHAFLNVAMVMGLFPVVGIPLPLVSYGGSQTLTTMIFLGIVAGIYKQKNLF